MKKIIFSDIDRTLAVEGVISDKNKKAIEEYIKKGGLFVLVSGRVINYTKKLSKSIDASQYIICTNGGVIYDWKENKIIYKNQIEFDVLKKLYDLSNKYDARLIFGGLKTIYTNKIKYPNEEEFISNITKDIYDKNPITQVTISHKNINVVKKIIIEVEKNSEVKILNRHRSLYDSSFKDNGNIWIDIAPKDINKGKAVLKLLEYLKINIVDSVRIGDDLNDLPMFLDKGLNVAVDNAMPDLKNKADFITLSCKDDGMAHLIEKIINNEL